MQQINDNFRLEASKPLNDTYLKYNVGTNSYVPYVSVAEANSLIAPEERSIGLFVVINLAGVGITLHWYKNGITNGDLVPVVVGGDTTITPAPSTITRYQYLIDVDVANLQNDEWIGGKFIHGSRSNGEIFIVDPEDPTTANFDVFDSEEGRYTPHNGPLSATERVLLVIEIVNN